MTSPNRQITQSPISATLGLCNTGFRFAQEIPRFAPGQFPGLVIKQARSPVIHDGMELRWIGGCSRNRHE